MFKNIRSDIKTAMERDPAARTKLEVLLTYPGVHILIFHRLAHWLWHKDLYAIGHLVAYLGRGFTGIEIHPAAVIGKGVFFDHGMGLVIGETAVVGDNVTLYQGVTLGGTSLEKGKRHPTLEEGVIVGAGAKILGPMTIGKNARIGSNAVVINEIPEDAVAVGIPAQVMGQDKKKKDINHDFCSYGLNTTDIPDPIAKSLSKMIDEICALRTRVNELEEEKK